MPSTGKTRKRESDLNDGESGPDYVSYLLRMWRESDAGEPSDDQEKPTWRVSVVSTLTGTRRGFSDLDGLFDFLRQQESTRLDRRLNQDQSGERTNGLEPTET